MERRTGFGPATFALARRRSTTEPPPRIFTRAFTKCLINIPNRKTLVKNFFKLFLSFLKKIFITFLYEFYNNFVNKNIKFLSNKKIISKNKGNQHKANCLYLRLIFFWVLTYKKLSKQNLLATGCSFF